MGTRGMVYVIDDANYPAPIVQIYSQCDSQPRWMGQKIYNFLANRKVVNGFGKQDKNVSNGMQDLAAQLVSYLKQTPYTITGTVYLYPVIKLPGRNQSFGDYVKDYMLPYARYSGCAYVYIIHIIDRRLEVQVWHDIDAPLFVGTPVEMKGAFDLEEAEY